MNKALRSPERLFHVLLWIVALVFAGFLIGLGSLVVRDLPTVDEHVALADFVDRGKAQAIDATIAVTSAQLKDGEAGLERAVLTARSGRAAYQSAKRSFDNWIATRSSTNRADQDPEVVTRTRQLDELVTAARKGESEVETIQAKQLALSQQKERAEEGRRALDDAARGDYDRALRRMELRVFGIRLAITLPPLLIAAWLFIGHRKSRWWPFVWGFIFFAVFTFFVELVPYLPSYGGYVRTIVGIVLTVLAGRYAIGAMQRYLERQRVAEQQSEAIRRQHLSYEHALKSMNGGVCPGCERAFKLHADGPTNFCMHCGMKLFDACTTCGSRKNAFFHYCPTCGADKTGTPPTDRVVAPLA